MDSFCRFILQPPTFIHTPLLHRALCVSVCVARRALDPRGDRRAGEREEDNCVDKREDRAEKCVTDGGRAEKRVLLQIQHISETCYPRTA